MSQATLLCQVGFGYEQEPDYTYFHTRNGEPIGCQFQFEEGDNLLDPFTVDDLVAGKVDYELLPEVFKILIRTLADRTYQAIQIENPEEGEKLNPDAIEACFHRRNMNRVLN